jgi:post-segregation antitoxin (ccd killing protein)
MPKVSVYVPDAMYDELRRRRLPVSHLAQQAFDAALRDDSNQAWIERATSRSSRFTSLPTEDLMARVDEEFDS